MTADVRGQITDLLDRLDAAREAIGDSPAFRVVGFEQDDEQVLARFDDEGTGVFAECYGVDAAALIVAAVSAVGPLTAAVRAVLDLADELDARESSLLRSGEVTAARIRAALSAVRRDGSTT